MQLFGVVNSEGARASAVLPIGFALFDQRAQTFLRILEAVEFVEEDIHGVLEAVAQRHSHAAEDGFFRHGEHRPGVAVDAIHEIGDSFFELCFGDEPIDHAQLKSAFGGHRFAGQDKLKGDFRSDQERKNRRSQRRKDANADFRLSKARLGSSNHEVSKSRELRAATDGRTVHDADDRLAEFEHAGKSGVEGVEHLEDALGGIFADVDATTKDFAGGIENNQLDVVALAGIVDAVGHFAKHGLIEKIVLGAVEGHAGDAAVATQLHEFEFFGSALCGG